MNLISLPPAGLLAPIVTTWENIHVCEAGIYPDKFGQIHSHQLIMWAASFTNYIPMMLEHQTFTWPFFGYVSGMRAKGTGLYTDFAFTRYGLEALHDYREKHMGSGWSIGITEGKKSVGEITLCRQPRVSTTHVVTLEDLSFDNIKLKQMGIRDADNPSSDIGDQIVSLVREIVDHEARNDEERCAIAMKTLQELIYCNNIRIPRNSLVNSEDE